MRLPLIALNGFQICQNQIGPDIVMVKGLETKTVLNPIFNDDKIIDQIVSCTKKSNRKVTLENLFEFCQVFTVFDHLDRYRK